MTNVSGEFDRKPDNARDEFESLLRVSSLAGGDQAPASAIALVRGLAGLSSSGGRTAATLRPSTAGRPVVGPQIEPLDGNGSAHMELPINPGWFNRPDPDPTVPSQSSLWWRRPVSRRG